MKNGNLDLGSLGTSASAFAKKIVAYKALIFFLAVASLYGFIIWRINTFSNAPASESEQQAKTTSQPRIDPATIQKIQSLQDNSVSVQTLFDDARQNPFNE
ncbi:MAG TPA: hypothetical protein VLF59_01285 [Candidatus Saccharimonadales bacterium]|nr:hypothetical protein [Candidatus Saccharimonadales bacterium]